MDTENKIIEMLEKKYKVFMLTKKQLSEVMGLSLSTIDNMLTKDTSKLPTYVKLGEGKKSSIRFGVIDVAKFLVRKDANVF